MRIWWCNQSAQWHVERPSEVVCSSDTTADGGNVLYRKFVGEVEANDLVVHYKKPYVVAFSQARENGRYYDQLPPLQGEDYGAGWRFRTKYFDLKYPVLRARFGKALIPVRAKDHPNRVKNYAINSRGFARQGYFFPFDLRGLSEILAHVDETIPSWLNKHRPSQFLLPEEIADDQPHWEGAVKRITVNAYERNPAARQRCIERYEAKCFICKFNFGKRYGEVAEGFIHVHHLKPLAEIGESYQVDPIEDLRPVCPNCHAVIHLRRDAPYTIEEVKAFRSKAKEKRNQEKSES